MFKIKQIPTIELINSIPDIENRVFSHYIPEYSGGKTMFNGIFRKDVNASANVIELDGKLVYSDYGERGCNDIFSFVSRIYGCTYYESPYYIDKDLNLGFYSNTGKNIPKITKEVKLGTPNKAGDTVLQVKKRAFEKHDLEYWSKYHLTKEDLIAYNIYPVSHIFIYKDDKLLQFVAQKYSYTFDFYWHEGIFRRKIYQPFVDGRGKWFSNINSTIIQGINIFPKTGVSAIITKGLKDAAVWYKVLGIPAIATNNEACFLPEEYFKKLRTRYPYLYINFDNDDTGIKNAEVFSEKYNLKNIVIPKIEGVKDISDFVAYSKTECIEFKNKLNIWK